MEERLPWSEIEKRFPRQWVELVDFEWPPTEPHPTGGVVISHSADRAEFDKQLLANPPGSSAIIKVGIKCLALKKNGLNGA